MTSDFKKLFTGPGKNYVLPGRGGWGKLAGWVMWPPPPVRYLTKEDGKTQASSHLSLLELPVEI